MTDNYILVFIFMWVVVTYSLPFQSVIPLV